MLKLPAFLHKQFPTGETVTVFQDDKQFWRFYLIPGFPTVRTLPNGDPVFLLVKYAFSDQSREANPELPPGGGYLVFDSELKVSDLHMEEVKTQLQVHADEEYARLKELATHPRGQIEVEAKLQDALGEHWGQQGHEGTRSPDDVSRKITLDRPEGQPLDLPPKAPEVVIGEPLWTEGKVTMSAPTSTALVSPESMPRERTASLIGNNVAAFSLDLTADGATFMQKTLIGESGTGATDLTPIQVTYELTMLAKLPPATMFLKFNTSQVYSAMQELFHEHTNCSDDYFTSENMMEMSLESGLIEIKIDMGGVVDDDLEQMLMKQAMDMSQELLTQKFADKERAPMEEWGTEELAESSREVYRLKRQTEVEMIDFEQTIEIATTTEFKIAPQGTLATFLRGRTDMDAFVREIDLDDDFFKTLGLKTRAFANWEEDNIAFVEVEVQYKHDSELKTNTFTFTAAEQEAQEWDPALFEAQREYSYRWRVAFEGRDPNEWSKWQKETTRDLNVAVETPGKLAVEVTGVGIDYENVVDAALVHLKYEDRQNDVPLASQSILLAKDSNSGAWNRQLFAPWAKPLEYRIEYLLKNGAKVEQGWTRTEGPTQNILVPRPDVDVLDVPLIPAGSWTGLVQTVLSLRYADGDYKADAQYNFTAQNEFKKWAVLLRNPSQRKFEYKVVSTFENGELFQSDWQQEDGDQAVGFKIGPDRLEVSISAATLDFASTPVVKIDLEFVDPETGSEIESFSLQKNDDVHKWSLPLSEGAPKDYKRKITYFPVEGDPVIKDWTVDNTELLMVPRVSVPKVGAQFLPTVQNFGITPVVEVNLTYSDPQRGVQEVATLVFTEKANQSWFLPVPEGAPKEYEMTITWHFVNGDSTSSEPIKLSKPAVVLRPPVAPPNPIVAITPQPPATPTPAPTPPVTPTPAPPVTPQPPAEG